MDDTRLKKLLYRARHRGFREADIIVGGFAEAHLRDLTPAQLDAFERLIEQPDHDIYNWIIGRDPTPEAFQGEIMDMIRAFRFSVHTALGEGRGS